MCQFQLARNHLLLVPLFRFLENRGLGEEYPTETIYDKFNNKKCLAPFDNSMRMCRVWWFGLRWLGGQS